MSLNRNARDLADELGITYRAALQLLDQEARGYESRKETADRLIDYHRRRNAGSSSSAS
ncbi:MULTISPECIES: hypothetical protein [unclassified Streptomyces]|uniref:hypothetical protein n=1 Tax=unclassified Streptomyces TaxID=2593676 RepID=UPI0033E93DEC